MPRLWAIFDLDGTLSDCSHRVHLIHAGKFDEFHAASYLDTPHEAEVRIAQAWYWAGGGLAFFTGRTEPFRRMTEDWLHRHGLIFADGLHLYMRNPEDDRSTIDIKREMLLEFEGSVMGPGDQVAFIMEDREKLVAMWRSLGLTCLQPRPGVY